MTEATERRLAKAIFAGVLLELLVGATFQVLRSARADGNAISVGEIGFLAVFLLFSIVGVLIATRRPDNALGWLMLVIGFVAFEPASGYGEYALAAGLPGGAWAIAAVSWTWVPMIGLALSVKLRLAQALVEQDPAKAHDMLAELQAETTAALEDLRDLARGTYPPLLADKGLVAALEAQARRSVVPVSISSNGSGRYPRDTEPAAYFCMLEALQNVAKYAGASHAELRLGARDGSLEFEVRDDGTGFDPASTGYGTGLQGMADRLAALDGALEVHSAPGAGATIIGRIPVAEVVD